MKFLQAIVLLISLNAMAQADIGIGIVSVKLNGQTVLKLYADPYDKEPKHILEFFNDENTESLDLKDFENHEKWLKPEIFAIEDNQLIFRCKSEERFWVEIIVNNETGESYWLRKTKTTDLNTWEGFLKEMFMISRNDFPQEIKTQPNDEAKEIQFDGDECFQVKTMKGDWIQIFTGPHCDDVGGGSLKSGWIRWKEGSKLLIDYFLTS
ncbi:hypothetical protein GGR22_000383 [Flavobacterium gossypii]|uniref:Uncharacterized protein n=2 Tax=Flavobacterium TaxID=237 RepID=A0A495MIP9_9FLAO|nr:MULTISPECIES: hypothetical protein [Flavobacterium]MBA9072257.1 hypothetical protein [Flavobacterium gossypii]RKS25308.1 hypothetical protein CLV94_0338 [Flavobacterium endophyticum]